VYTRPSANSSAITTLLRVSWRNAASAASASSDVTAPVCAAAAASRCSSPRVAANALSSRRRWKTRLSARQMSQSASSASATLRHLQRAGAGRAGEDVHARRDVVVTVGEERVLEIDDRHGDPAGELRHDEYAVHKAMASGHAHRQVSTRRGRP
jgi:hypothetical protein